jgi:hypothetical protein
LEQACLAGFASTFATFCASSAFPQFSQKRTPARLTVPQLEQGRFAVLTSCAAGFSACKAFPQFSQNLASASFLKLQLWHFMFDSYLLRRASINAQATAAHRTKINII